MSVILKKVKNKIKNYMILLYYNFFKIKYNKIVHYDILDDKEVINEIIYKNKSLARFGDGEFKWIMHIKQNSFQKDDFMLSNKLKECLYCNNNPNLLIGIPRALINIDDYNKYAKNIWKKFICSYGMKCYDLIPKNKIYADTNITRFYMDYKDKSNVKNRIDNLKLIWENRDIVIVEGLKTKMGVNNDLFNNAKSIHRLLVPNKDAFDKYNDIYNEVIKQNKKNLILLSIGPTATVLANDLSKIGFQAIDIGHIDVEYEWYLTNAKKKIPIKGKYVNEAIKIGDYSNYPIENDEYNKSIIRVIR